MSSQEGIEITEIENEIIPVEISPEAIAELNEKCRQIDEQNKNNIFLFKWSEASLF